MAKICFAASFLIAMIVFTIYCTNEIEARYLPTRSNSDRIDKLRELLKEVKCNGNKSSTVRKNPLRRHIELLESEIEKEEYQSDSAPRWHPDSKLFYKREIPSR